MTAHQSKRDEDGYEFQEYIFTIATEENCKIFGGGMIKDRVENPYMTVYVRTNSGKTISIKCDSRQNATRIMEMVERKTLIPRDQLYLVNQGKVLKDKKTTEESNIEAGATTEMFLRIMGGMNTEEVMVKPETEEDNKRKLHELSESKSSRLSDDAEHLRREIINGIKKIRRKDGKLLEKNRRTNGKLLEKNGGKNGNNSAYNHELSRPPNTVNELNH